MEETPEQLMKEEDLSRLDVLHVLLLLQAAFGVLGGVAMLIFMAGNPAVIPIALGTPLLLFLLAAGVVRRWRWARRATLAVQWLIMLGFAVSTLIGMLAVVNFSVNLLTLITNLVMPLAVIRLLRRPRASEVAVRPGRTPQPVAASVAGAA